MTKRFDPCLWLHDIVPEKAEARRDYFEKIAHALSADHAVRRAMGSDPDDAVHDAFRALVRANLHFARAQVSRLSPPSDPQSPVTP